MNITNKNRYKLSAKFNKILAGLNEEEIRFAGDQKRLI